MKPSEYILDGGETPPPGIDTHPEPYEQCPATYGGVPGHLRCAKRAGHTGPHVSSDGKVKWGKMGLQRPDPVRVAVTLDDEGRVTGMQGAPPPNRTLLQPSGKALGYTGIPCDSCGSLNTVRNGKCLQCMDCMASGECG